MMKIKNKKFALILFLVVFLGIVSPFKNVALGYDWNWILSPLEGAASDLGDAIMRSVLGLIVAIPVSLLEIGQGLLSAVISPDFLGISMTGPDNVVVTYGWQITRDLANICLLLGLVVIGLGIILGIEEYQAKKTLPRLISIALLINFTLVICGFVLDFANLLMNYLLGAGSLGTGLSNEITNWMAKLAGADPLKSLGLILILFVFGIVAFIVYLLYALLFIARYVYLWILIIISPIAFASRVFPSSGTAKSFFPSFFSWDEWWKSFIQWATIGIYAAFFIALANRLMVAMASGVIVSAKLTALGSLFSYIFPLILLLFGFFAILDAGSSVPGFSKIGGYAKAGLAGAAVVTAGAAAGAVAGATVGVSRSFQRGEGPIGWAVGAAKGGGTSEGREEGRKWYRKTAEKIPYIGPKPGTYEKEMQEEVAKAEKGMENMSKEERAHYGQNKLIFTRQGHINRAAAKNVQSRKGEHTDESLNDSKIYKVFGFDEDEALKRMPHKVNEVGSTKTVAEVVGKQAPSDFAKNAQVEALKDFHVLDAMSPAQMKTLMEKGSEDKKKAVAENAKINETVLDAILGKTRSDKAAAIAAGDKIKEKECEKIINDIDEKRRLLIAEGYL